MQSIKPRYCFLTTTIFKYCIFFQLTKAFALGGEIFGLGFKKGSFWARFFSIQLLKLQDRGVLKGMFQMMPIRKDLLCESQEQDDNVSLGIEKLVALVLIILAGIFSAFFIFPIELILNNKTKEVGGVRNARLTRVKKLTGMTQTLIHKAK